MSAGITWIKSPKKHSRSYALQFNRVVGRVFQSAGGWTCALEPANERGPTNRIEAKYRFGPIFPAPELAKEYFEKNWPADLDAELRLSGQ